MKQLLFLLMVVFTTGTTYSQPGSIDNSFGQEGFVRTNITTTGFYSLGKGSALQADGKILVGGNYYSADVIRYLPNGIIDSSFGKNGVATLDNISGSVDCIAIQPDGKIVVAGNKLFAPYTEHVFAARFMPDGSIDASFGKEGVAKLDFDDYAGVDAITLQPDGKLLLAGGATTNIEDVIFAYGTVTRLTKEGTIDKTFGNTGREKNNGGNESTCITLQPDGKIVTGGFNLSTQTFFEDFVVSRYNSDGSLDETFGTGGNTVTAGYNYEGTAKSILLQPDGRIVIGGYSVIGSDENYFMIAQRYDSKGVLDPTFGEKGKVIVAFDGKNSKAYSALLQADGKIILAGGAYNDLTLSGADFALCRLNTDGNIDSSFGIDGRQITEADTTAEEAQSALLQPDGKIVLVGYSQNNIDASNANVLLVRYNGDKGQNPLLAKIKRFLHNHGIGWQGLDNTNINYYSVQYSKTGNGFTEKGKVSGTGSSRFTPYEFAVADAGYYRIVAVDRKGYKTFSNKVMVSEADLSASAASVFPNPAKDYVTVQGLQTNETANISIADGSGNVMSKGVSNGAAQYRFQISNLFSGTYYINITTASKTEVLKFVKE